MSRRNARIVLAALAAAAALGGLAGDTTCVMAQAPVTGGSPVVAQSPSCRSSCLSEYNQCRITTKGAPTCDSAYQVCLQSCLVQR